MASVAVKGKTGGVDGFDAGDGVPFDAEDLHQPAHGVAGQQEADNTVLTTFSGQGCVRGNPGAPEADRPSCHLDRVRGKVGVVRELPGQVFNPLPKFCHGLFIEIVLLLTLKPNILLIY